MVKTSQERRDAEEIPEEHTMQPWSSLPTNHPTRMAREEQYRKIRALKESWKEWENSPRISEETLANAITGYAARIDQLLLGCKEYPNCGVRVDLSQQPLILRLPDNTTIPMSAIASAMEFCTSSLSGKRSLRIAEAITISLKTHRNLLPKVIVECEGENVILRPEIDQTLAAFLREQ